MLGKSSLVQDSVGEVIEGDAAYEEHRDAAFDDRY